MKARKKMKARKTRKKGRDVVTPARKSRRHVRNVSTSGT